MDRCISFWKQNRGGYLWQQIESRKDPFIEPRGSSAFNAIVRNFETQAKTDRGAVFFGVCRGKASEGIDFPDHCARGVIITGIPYAPHKDHKVVLKREYLDHNKRLGKSHLDGHTWYAQTALRAINQAIGRVIRHRFDYGAIFLCDERFGSTKSRSVINGISNWLKPLCRHYETFGDVVRAVSFFFRVARGTPEWNRKKTVANTASNIRHRNNSAMAAIQDNGKKQLPDDNQVVNGPHVFPYEQQQNDGNRNIVNQIAASLATYEASKNSSPGQWRSQVHVRAYFGSK